MYNFLYNITNIFLNNIYLIDIYLPYIPFFYDLFHNV